MRASPDQPEAPMTPPPTERGATRPEAGPGNRWIRGSMELVRTAALILLFFFLVRSLVVEAFKIPTSSMEGTLLAGDFLLVNKAAYGAEIPVLAYRSPPLRIPIEEM